MDLVAGVRKEGSRGGRDSFKWEDVKESQHRENYLGHSLMAPVGRWQKGKDLQWYAKADQIEADKAQAARAEEIRRVKEAEQEAMARALGLPVAPKTANANLTPLGGKEVQKVVQETTAEDDAAGEGGRGVGFGAYGGGMNAGDPNERMEAVGIDPDERPGRKEKRDRSRERRRDRSRDRDRDREHRHSRHHHNHERHRHERRHRSRSRSRSRDRAHRRRRSPSRSRSRDRRRDDDYGRPRRRERSYSPDGRHEHRHRRRERDGDYERRR
ncbi:hypothetical protein VTN02DRAFT_1028 [Thermoascus thermophilus]